MLSLFATAAAAPCKPPPLVPLLLPSSEPLSRQLVAFGITVLWDHHYSGTRLFR